MKKRLFNRFKGKNGRRKTRARPCGMCALAAQIDNEKDLGMNCLLFGLRIAPDEISDSESDIRRKCIRQGNFFEWRTLDVTADRALELKLMLSDWYFKRTVAKTALVVAAISMVATAIGVIVSYLR